jgi:hypothetical protein
MPGARATISGPRDSELRKLRACLHSPASGTPGAQALAAMGALPLDAHRCPDRTFPGRFGGPGRLLFTTMPCPSCRQIARGAVGVTKVALRVDRTRDGDLRTRLALCALCPSLRGAKCGRCRCYVQLKARVASETCPAGLWP